MRIRIGHDLPYAEAELAFRGRSVQIADVILDTGSAGTIFSVDRLLEIGLVPEPRDRLIRIRGVGGTGAMIDLRRLELGPSNEP